MPGSTRSQGWNQTHHFPCHKEPAHPGISCCPEIPIGKRRAARRVRCRCTALGHQHADGSSWTKSWRWIGCLGHELGADERAFDQALQACGSWWRVIKDICRRMKSADAAVRASGGAVRTAGSARSLCVNNSRRPRRTVELYETMRWSSPRVNSTMLVALRQASRACRQPHPAPTTE